MYDKHVFLGGTCGDNHWRENILIPLLKERGITEDQWFNPVVEHWDEAAQRREDEAKRTCDYVLFVIASPDPKGATANVSAYSIVEMVMHLYDEPERTVVLFDTTGMPKHTTKAIAKSMQDLEARFPHAPIFTEYQTLANWLARRLR